MTGRPTLEDARRIGRCFGLEADSEDSIAVVAGGHINESFRIETADGALLLQWINPAVFPRPHAVADNVACVLDHLAAADPDGGWPTLASTTDGRRRVEDEQGLWRALRWLPDRLQLERPNHPAEARVGAGAFGRFLTLLGDLDPARLQPVLPGFHDLDRRLQDFDAALAAAAPIRRQQAAALLQQVAEDRDGHRLPVMAGQERVIHGDTKFANLLFTADRRAALAVDYDTVMPGALWMDFGDMLRSAASVGAEDDPAGGRVADAMLQAATEGFRQALAVDAAEATVLAAGPARMAFMLGVRFLTDFLTGDRYFRIRHPQQNLHRAQHQLGLSRELAERADHIGGWLLN